MSELRRAAGLCLVILVLTPLLARASDQPTAVLPDYFPAPEEQAGWRTLLPPDGEPDGSQKAPIRSIGGMAWDALKAAWDHNAAVPGATGLLVIRRGYVVGEWYKGCDRTTAFNIYSSSKSYTSTL
jgi:CubicO group peptidase (beta-lactamase class C family)